ncbi:MAG: hypothetical protein GXO76_12650 [Calditrichaeota bacterium]|nr:hypothetical protein [Calditrichota bacterium]
MKPSVPEDTRSVRDSIAKYSHVKSQFIRNVITGKHWNLKDQRKYIDDLIAIEDFILNGNHTAYDSLVYSLLKERYAEEFKAIAYELKPEIYTHFVESERLEIKKLEHAEDSVQEELQLKQDWINAGGLE